MALERVVVDAVMMDRATVAFMERLEKRRAKEVLVKEEKKVLAPVIYLYRIIYLNNMERIRLACD
ncbi:hypothetical protein [Intestinibacter sp.]|uniref:hypothetical protein n=1 Tax=Intestinibacter sp. TaxID=1965304 RepID=UPI0025F9F401|nr:hypothetical protein [uncultured Intestinibacter sp.]